MLAGIRHRNHGEDSMRRTLPSMLITALAAVALAACGGSDDTGNGAGGPTPPVQDPPAPGEVSVDEFCPDFRTDLAPLADTYDASLHAVNDAYLAEDQDAVDDTVAELETHAANLSALFREGAGTVADAGLSAALARTADELDSHIAAIGALDVADYGDPEHTPDGIAFQEAISEVLTTCD